MKKLPIFLFVTIISLLFSCSDKPQHDYPPKVYVKILDNNIEFKKGDIVHVHVYYDEFDTEGTSCPEGYICNYGDLNTVPASIKSFSMKVTNSDCTISQISGLFGFTKVKDTDVAFERYINIYTSMFDFKSDSSKLFIDVQASDDENNIAYDQTYFFLTN